MDRSMTKRETVEVIRWHILRADGQRSGMWTRAATVLSADALVIAGAAVLVSVASKAAWWSLVTAALPLAAAMISVYEASNVIGGVQDWGRTFTEENSPAPMFYSLPDTVKALRTYDQFRSNITGRSIESEVDDAASELWRISVLHRMRLRQLRRSIRWLQISLPLLILSVGVITTSLAG